MSGKRKMMGRGAEKGIKIKSICVKESEEWDRCLQCKGLLCLLCLKMFSSNKMCYSRLDSESGLPQQCQIIAHTVGAIRTWKHTVQDCMLITGQPHTLKPSLLWKSLFIYFFKCYDTSINLLLIRVMCFAGVSIGHYTRGRQKYTPDRSIIGYRCFTMNVNVIFCSMPHDISTDMAQYSCGWWYSATVEAWLLEHLET